MSNLPRSISKYIKLFCAGTYCIGAFFMPSQVSLSRRPRNPIHEIYSYCNKETGIAGEFPETGGRHVRSNIRGHHWKSV